MTLPPAPPPPLRPARGVAGLRPLASLLAVAVLAGCATRAANVPPRATDPSEFTAWGCDRLADELDAVQQRAAERAYDVDERVGNNIVALGVGVTIFWPAMFALRPDGPEAEELARLKGRDEALRATQQQRGCPPPTPALPPARAAALPVAVGDRLVYEDRHARRGPPAEWVLQVNALQRDSFDFSLPLAPGNPPWRQDPAGNVTAAPAGMLHWPRLLRRELALGQILGGELAVAGEPLLRGRVRGQVVAVGPQSLGGRSFDAAVIDLFGDAQRGDESTRLTGVIVIDRASGVLLRLDLDSAMPEFRLQRRLQRVERAPAP